jgi:CHAT domain-containing protein/Tfp pilus assembly protein PilF
MRLIPRIGFFVLVTLFSTTSATFPFESTVKPSLSSTIFPTSQVLAQSQDVRRAKANQLQQQGIKQLNQNQFEEALKSLQQALTIYQEIKARQEEGQTLKHLGNVYYSLENYKQAFEYQYQALKIAQTIKDRDLEWRTLNNIGLNYYWQSDYSKALDYYQQSLAISRVIKEREGQALTLGNLGDVYYEQEDYPQAIEYYRQSLTIAQEIKAERLEAMALFGLGKSYDSLEKYDDAIKYFEETLLVAKKVDNPSFEKAISVRLALTYGELALAYEMKGNYDKAVESYQRSLTKAQKIKDAKTKGLAREGIERVQEKIGKQAQAEQLLQQGIKQREQGKAEAAKQSFQQALNLDREIGNTYGELQILNHLGSTYQTLKEFTEAIEVLKYQLLLSQELNNLPFLSSALAQLQGIYLQQKDYHKSIEYGQLLLQAAQDLKNNQFEGEIGGELENLGIEMEALALDTLIMAYQLDGDLSKAIEYSQKNLDIAIKLEDSSRQGEAIYQLGNIYGELNNYVKAIDYLEESNNIAQEIDHHLLKAMSLQNLGTLYFSLGDFDKAIEYTNQALTVAKKFNHRWWIGKPILSEPEKDRFRKLEQETLVLSGSGYLFGFGNIDEAIDSYEQAQKLAQESQIPRNEALAVSSLATAYGVIGDYRQAINHYEQALKIGQEKASEFDRIEDNQEAVSLNILAYAYGSLGKAQEKQREIGAAQKSFQTAIEYAQKSLAIVEQFENSKIETASSLSALGRTYFLMGNVKESEKYLREAIKIFEDVGTKLRIGDSKQVFFLDIYADEYELLQQVLIAQDRFDEALEVAEQGRTRAFVELLAKRLTPNPTQESPITPPTIEQIKKIAQEQNATLVNYSIIHDPSQFLMPVKIKGKGQNSASELFIWVVKPKGEVAFRRVNIQDVLSNQGEISREKLTSNYQLAAIFISPWITATTIVILVTFIGLGVWRFQWLQSSAKFLQHQIKNRPSRFWLSVLLVTALSGGLVYLGLSNQQTASNQQTVAGDGSGDYTQLGKASVSAKISEPKRKKLYKLLIEPIADLLPTDSKERIIFIPQGALFYIPFPALQNSSGEYLIDRHTMLTAPSIQVLDLTHQLRQRLEAKDLITAQAQDILVIGNPTMPTKINSDKKWDALESAEKEAKAIAALLNTQAITGEQATEDTIVQRIENARIIHLGTHGKADEERGFGSKIILAPSDKNDGYFTAEEILNLNLNAELVVLSACETGVGRLTGDGLVGLSRSFIQAGTPSIVISLWTVPEKTLIGETSTKDLMIQFYRELQQNPDKAQALRQAMLKTREKHPKPIYWAAFTLIGEAE